jgi:hypothetical protein
VAFNLQKPRALRRRAKKDRVKIAERGGSKGVATLVDAWGTGDIAGNLIYKIVTNFADDMDNKTATVIESMKALSLSPGTMDYRNSTRDLMRRFTVGGELPEPIIVACPLNVARTGGTVIGKVSIIAPHEMFAMLHDNYKGDFEKRIGTLNKIKEYWEGADIVNDPKFRDHPVLKIPRYAERCIPIAIHGDGGPYTQKKQNVQSIDVMSWSSELGEGWSLDVPFSHAFSH